jgi:membrane protease YdiL (CAAX protease family)
MTSRETFARREAPFDATRSVAIYIALVILFSAPWTALLLHADRLDIARGFPIHTLMWAPAMAAFATCFLTRTSFSFLGLGWPPTRFVAWGYLLPIGYSVAAYLVLWVSGLAPQAFAAFGEASRKALQIGAGAGVLNGALILTFGVLQSGVSAAGEEIGWRGFLVPALARRLSVAGVVLVSGLIWAVWHFPLILFADYNSPAPKPYALACFTVMIVATGAMAAWLRLKSGSVWPAVLLHACHNAVIQWLLDFMTVEEGRAAWFAGEFGVGLALTSTLFAVALPWRGSAGPPVFGATSRAA